MSLAQSKLKIWIDSTRPKTLSAAVAPVLIGTVLAKEDGQFQPMIFLATLTAAVLIQIGTNLSNDYFDFIKGADTDERTGPTRATQAGLVPPPLMKWASVGVFIAAAFLGLYLITQGGWPIMLIGILSILSGILYTAGPYPLGYIGLGDVFVLVFFGPLAVGGTYYLQTHSMSRIAVLAGLIPGLISTAILTVNNLRDYQTDKSTGKKTLVVRFGKRFGVTEYCACVIIASLIPVVLCWFTREHFLSLVSLLSLSAVRKSFYAILSRNGTAEMYNQALADTGRFLLLFSILFSVSWLL
jgi:1,4-dihydroxy-2-naphthoate octaprenyltransferase